MTENPNEHSKQRSFSVLRGKKHHDLSLQMMPYDKYSAHNSRAGTVMEELITLQLNTLHGTYHVVHQCLPISRSTLPLRFTLKLFPNPNFNLKVIQATHAN